MKHIEKDPLQVRVEIANWFVLLLLLSVGALFFSWQFVLSILVGGFISIVNFHWLYRDLSRMFTRFVPSRPAPKASSFIMNFFFRFGVIAIVLYLLLASGAFNVFGVVVGLSVVVLNLILTTVWLVFKKNRFEEA